MFTGLPVAALPVALGCPNLSVRPTISTCYAFKGASRCRSARYHRAPPTGSTKDRPSADIPPGVHSRLRPFELPRPTGAFGASQPATRSFRPRGFSPPRRLSPPAARRLVASCCRPWGSSGFSRMLHQRRLAHVIVLPLRCHTLQSFPHPYSRICVPADRCPLAVAGCVLFPGPARLQGVAPYERPLRLPPLPVTYARCSLGLPVLGASRPSSLSPSRPKPDGARCRPLGGDRVSQEEAGPSTCGALPKKQTAPDRRPQPCKGAGLPASRTAGNRRPRPTQGRYGRPTDMPIAPSAPIAGTRPGCPGPAAGAASPRRPDHVAVVGEVCSCWTSRPCLLGQRRPPRRDPKAAAAIRVKSKRQG